MMISVCIPTYNGARYIKDQIVSILDQTVAVDEIIISDDSSTDTTIEIVRSFNDPRISILTNQQFFSPIYNMEHALKHARGDYLFMADQDDIWEPEKVERMLEQLNEHLLVVSDGTVIDTNGNVLHPSIFELFNSGNGFIKNLKKSAYMGCCMAFRKDLLAYILPFPKGIAMHDLWIGLNAEIYDAPFFYPQKLIRYRRHEQNRTPLDARTNTNKLVYKLSFRVKILILVLLRYVKIKVSKTCGSNHILIFATMAELICL